MTNLHELFADLQTELDAKLHTNRKHIDHPGTKGDASELDWIGMLRDYLPKRYQVEKAFVLDSDGRISAQIDIVIFDRQYCPLLFNHSGALYVPAESVYAVFEVKQVFNKEWIDDAGEKAGSVRTLQRTSAPIPHAGGTYESKPQFEILAGILALESDWSPGLGLAFNQVLCDQPQKHRLDLGCSLRHGSFEATYPTNGDPEIKSSKPENALIFFFLRLVHRLQQLGTAPAIDIDAYARNL